PTTFSQQPPKLFLARDRLSLNELPDHVLPRALARHAGENTAPAHAGEGARAALLRPLPEGRTSRVPRPCDRNAGPASRRRDPACARVQQLDSDRRNRYALRVHKIPVGVLGASGYAGRELCSLIAGHPKLELAFAAANSRRGELIRVGAGAEGRDVALVATGDAPLGDAAVVFAALPHGASAEWVARSSAAGSMVVDLSSDLRPGNELPVLDDTLSGMLHQAAPYGLTEHARDAV